MAYDSGKQPLITEQHEPTSSNRKITRSRSAPIIDLRESDDERFYVGPMSISEQLNPHFKTVAIYLLIFLSIGTLCFYLFSNNISGPKTFGVLDSIYFCIVTITTVGYGDLIPDNTATKLLSCAFVFAGVVLIGLTLSKATDRIVKNQQILLLETLHLRQKPNSIQKLRETETKRVRYKCIRFSIFLAILMVFGTIFLITVEKMEIVDAFYCVCSTITTLGYGDKSFSTLVGRIFAIFWILLSIICLGQLLFAFAEYYTEIRQRSFVRWVLTSRTMADYLQAAHVDDDGVVA